MPGLSQKIAYVLGILIPLTLLAASLTFPSAALARECPETARAIINDVHITVRLACDPEAIRNGLSRVESLGLQEGMLFILPQRRMASFWMKEMNFPLDIIWIDQNRVVGIEVNCPPEGERPTRRYPSPGPVDMVLEVNAGFADRHNIGPGDAVRIE
ncbi:MAG: DUF192 domain-containing protein [Desulfovibrionales bacterium]